MERRWNVYHRGEFFGLKTAREIREALRQGAIDPFDKVSAEGSNIREDLIEVDEIFRETNEQFAKAAANGPIFSATPIPKVEEEPAVAIPVVFPEPSPPKTSEPQRIGSKTESTPAGSDRAFEETRADAIAKQPAAKRYYLIDRKKTLGPLSALEIQSLFNRGLLNKSVRVQKIGGQRTIPIHQFIANYAGDRLKELAGDGKIPQQIGLGSPSSRVMNELTRMVNSKRRAADRRNRAYLLLTGLGFLIGALLYLFATTPNRNLNESKNRGENSSSRTEEKGAPATKASKGQRPRLIQKSPEATETLAPSPTPTPEPPAKVPPKTPSNQPTTARTQRAIQTRIKPQQATKKSKPTEIRSRPVRPTIPVQPKPVSAPAKTAGDSPIARAKSSAGRIQSVGPVFFTPAALDACANKCKLPMRDASGATMTAVFFKSAYYEQLRNLNKGVTLTGSTRVEKGELVLIIQDIR